MNIKPRIVKIELAEPVEFEWDGWNIGKNLSKHKVTVDEAEQAFNDAGKQIFGDTFHSHKEKRFIIIGQTRKNRVLYVAFTLRNKRVRVISARDLNRKERYLHEKKVRNS